MSKFEYIPNYYPYSNLHETNLDGVFDELSQIRAQMGTNNYEDMKNKPQIEGNELIGNKTAAEMGLATAAALEAKQDALTAGDGIDIVDDVVGVKVNETLEIGETVGIKTPEDPIKLNDEGRLELNIDDEDFKVDDDKLALADEVKEAVTAVQENAEAWSGKQDELVAGANITIVGNTISASGQIATVAAGTGLTLTSQNVMNHSNSIEGRTVGGWSGGRTVVPEFQFNSTGHITYAGSRGVVAPNENATGSGYVPVSRSGQNPEWKQITDTPDANSTNQPFSAKGAAQLKEDLTLAGDNGIEISEGVVSHTNNVQAGTCGDAATIPQISYDAQGHITSAIAVPISIPAGGVIMTSDGTTIPGYDTATIDLGTAKPAIAFVWSASTAPTMILPNYLSGTSATIAGLTTIVTFNEHSVTIQRNGSQSGTYRYCIIGV